MKSIMCCIITLILVGLGDYFSSHSFAYIVGFALGGLNLAIWFPKEHRATQNK